MQTSCEARSVLMSEERPRILLFETCSQETLKAKRPESRPDPITLRELAVAIGVVAIGLRELPHTLDYLVATGLPPVYFLTRMYLSLLRPLGLLGFLACVALPFIPTWITDEPSDFGLAKAVVLFSVPGLARLETWWDRTG
jgi:hypothetical protein